MSQYTREPDPLEDTSCRLHVVEFATDTGRYVRAVRQGPGQPWEVYVQDGSGFHRVGRVVATTDPGEIWRALLEKAGQKAPAPPKWWEKAREA